ncbi:N-acetyltransferase [Aneurinibacillus migulanus]|uniref:N-acetyltransferase n=1 Tax=Aneurinibacillus migulanus TaxID=47500 RepID=UPI0020A1FC8C|nr:N-acetyltransferase [Aneurinibacillus migulanus]MCP1354965.1 N-acetyltransferase [Aneurinibacillus migulanus]
MGDLSIKVGKNVVMGENVTIESNVMIGDNVIIGNYVVIKKNTIIGNNVKIGDLVVLGKEPASNKKMARKPNTKLPPLEIKDGVTIGCNTVIYYGVVLHEDVLVGDISSIREDVVVGESSIIGRNVMVEPATTIGRKVTIQTGCYITANMIIEDEVFIGPCCSSANDKYMGMGNFQHKGPIIKRGAKIGNNATLLPGITIGEKAIVGAGAVITRDVAPNKIVVGNPGRPLG